MAILFFVYSDDVINPTKLDTRNVKSNLCDKDDVQEKGFHEYKNNNLDLY